MTDRSNSAASSTEQLLNQLAGEIEDLLARPPVPTFEGGGLRLHQTNLVTHEVDLVAMGFNDATVDLAMAFSVLLDSYPEDYSIRIIQADADGIPLAPLGGISVQRYGPQPLGVAYGGDLEDDMPNDPDDEADQAIDAGGLDQLPLERDVEGCCKAFDRVGKKIARLDEPCRTVVMVYAAWGIIENGGFQYFFEANFDGRPPYDAFVQAFARVGLRDVSSGLAKLVRFFPFSEPHLFAGKRNQFMDAEPPEFLAAASKLEDLIYRYECGELDGVLNAFLARERGTTAP